jgi:hypothetical protein
MYRNQSNRLGEHVERQAMAFYVVIELQQGVTVADSERAPALAGGFSTANSRRRWRPEFQCVTLGERFDTFRFLPGRLLSAAGVGCG